MSLAWDTAWEVWMVAYVGSWNAVTKWLWINWPAQRQKPLCTKWSFQICRVTALFIDWFVSNAPSKLLFQAFFQLYTTVMKALTLNTSLFYEGTSWICRAKPQIQKATVTAQLSVSFHDEIESFNHPDSTWLAMLSKKNSTIHHWHWITFIKLFH